MISGTLLRVLLTNSCTATAITSKRTRTKTLFIGIKACNESFPQTAFYHKTAQRSDDDSKLTAGKGEEMEIDNSIMTRTKIAELIAHDYDISQSKAERIIRRIFHEISQNIVDGKKVSISGFGSFTKVKVKERTIIHPQTGDPLTIPSRLKAKFTSFRALKETINSENLTS